MAEDTVAPNYIGFSFLNISANEREWYEMMIRKRAGTVTSSQDASRGLPRCLVRRTGNVSDQLITKHAGLFVSGGQ